MELEDKRAQAESELREALAYTNELIEARREILLLLDDIRVYRNLLALQHYGQAPARDPHAKTTTRHHRTDD